MHNKFKYSMGWHNFTNVLSKNLLILWHPSFFLDRGMSKGLGIDRT
jgi:hypothetical protein